MEEKACLLCDRLDCTETPASRLEPPAFLYRRPDCGSMKSFPMFIRPAIRFKKLGEGVLPTTSRRSGIYYFCPLLLRELCIIPAVRFFC